MSESNYRLLSLLILAVLICSGCKTMGLDSTKMWKSEEEQELGEPVKMVITWKDTVRYSPGDPATRGFGGRIHFYDIMNQPVKTQGKLITYGFNDSSDRVNSDEPERKYVFDASDFETHYSLSKLGHSYSFWLPWDEAGGFQKSVALSPFFTATNGQVIMSEQSRQILPGKMVEELPTPKSIMPAQQQYGDVVPVGYASAAKSSLNTNREVNKLRTTTIHVPESMDQRMRNAVPRDSNTETDRLRSQLMEAKRQLDAQNRQEGKLKRAESLHPINRESKFGVSTGVNLQKFSPSHLYNSNLNQDKAQSPVIVNGPLVTTSVGSEQQLTRSLPPRSQAPLIRSVQLEDAYRSMPQFQGQLQPGFQPTQPHQAMGGVSTGSLVR